MNESTRSVRRRRPGWKPLFPRIGLPLLAHPAQRPHRHLERYPCPRLLPEGSSVTREDSPRVHSSDLSRFKLLSVDDLSPTKAVTTDSDVKIISEGATIALEDRSDEGFGDPFLEDGFGNLTTWRLSDLKKAFDKHIEDKMNERKTKEKKPSKLEMLKWHNNRMEEFMKASLKKYNNEENLDEDLRFEFVKGLKESLIVEVDGCCKMYRHFNFEAMQSASSISVFFAEVILHGENYDVTCCKLLGDDDNARCLGCINQGHPGLKHPASDNVYVGGHMDCMFPFLIDSDSEDDSD